MSDNLLTAPVTVESVDVALTDVHCRERHSSETYKRMYAKDRIYLFAEDWTVLGHLTGRWTSPVKVYRKLLPEILKAAGLPEGTKASWSQYAGCSCPCSPGFVIDSHTGQYGRGRDIYVTWKDLAAEREQREDEIKRQFASFIDA